MHLRHHLVHGNENLLQGLLTRTMLPIQSLSNSELLNLLFNNIMKSVMMVDHRKHRLLTSLTLNTALK